MTVNRCGNPRVRMPEKSLNPMQERLRPGRVAVRGEQLIAVEALLRAASQAMEGMRKQLQATKLAVPPTPSAAPLMPAFQAYADRARRALAAAGLKEAL